MDSHQHESDAERSGTTKPGIPSKRDRPIAIDSGNSSDDYVSSAPQSEDQPASKKKPKLIPHQHIPPEIIAHIAKYHSQHLQLRLVNSAFDHAVQELHLQPSDGCTSCSCTADISQFAVKRNRLRFIKHWKLSGSGTVSTSDAGLAWIDSISKEETFPWNASISEVDIATITASIGGLSYEMLQFLPVISHDTLSVVINDFMDDREHAEMMQLLCDLPSLASFKSRYHSIPPWHLDTFLRCPFPKLASLDLSNTMTADDQALQLLSSSSTLQSTLTYFSLDSCPISDFGIPSLVSSPFASKLKKVPVVLGTSSTPESIWNFLFALNSSLCRVEELEIESRSEDTEEFERSFLLDYSPERVRHSMKPCNLKRLFLSFPVTEGIARVLATLPIMSTVELLALFGIVDESAIVSLFGPSSYFCSLKSLMLSGNGGLRPVTDKSIESIASSPLSHAIKDMSFWGALFSSACARIVATTPHFQTNLRKLVIDCNRDTEFSISVDVVMLLSSLKSLHTLIFTTNPLLPIDSFADKSLKATEIASRIERCLDSPRSLLRTLALPGTAKGIEVTALLEGKFPSLELVSTSL